MHNADVVSEHTLTVSSLGCGQTWYPSRARLIRVDAVIVMWWPKVLLVGSVVEQIHVAAQGPVGL